MDFESQIENTWATGQRGKDMANFGISWDTFGGSRRFAEKAAEEGLMIEVLVRRATKPSQFLEDLADAGLLRLHGAWWSRLGRSHQAKEHPLKWPIFEVMIGSWEDNPASRLATQYGAPLVMHHGVLRELLAQGKTIEQMGLPAIVEVENENYQTYPWGSTAKFSTYNSCMETITRARSEGPKCSHVLDIGHLAETDWDPKAEVFDALLERVLCRMREGGIVVSSAHLSEYDPYSFGEHLFLRGNGDLDVSVCAQLLVRHNPDITLILEAPSVSYVGSYQRRFNPQPWYDKAIDDIRWLKDQLALSV